MEQCPTIYMELTINPYKCSNSGEYTVALQFDKNKKPILYFCQICGKKWKNKENV